MQLDSECRMKNIIFSNQNSFIMTSVLKCAKRQGLGFMHEKNPVYGEGVKKR